MILHLSLRHLYYSVELHTGYVQHHLMFDRYCGWTLRTLVLQILQLEGVYLHVVLLLTVV